MEFDDEVIDRHVNTKRYSMFYNTVLSDVQRTRFHIFAQRCCNTVGIQLQDESLFVNKVVHLFMLKHYFMLD